MANVRHAAKLREGARAWNAWRTEDPGIAPDLSDLRLPDGARRFGLDEGGPIDLSGANLRRAVLAGADLANARLDDADLSGADLSGANLSQADLTGARLAGADLSGAWLGDARGLTQAQIDRAYGQTASVLPDHLAVPPGWLGEEPAAPPHEADRVDEEAEKGADRGAGRGGKPARDSGAESDPYSILGVGRKASQSEIRAAYLRLVKKLHPDGRPPGAEADDAAERLKLINDANQKLKGADRQATARRAEHRHRASAVFVAGVMTAVAPLVVAGLYAAWWLRAPSLTTTVAMPDRAGGGRPAARDSAQDKPGARPGAGSGAGPGAVETGAISVHVKEMDGGRGRVLAAARKQGTREAWDRFIAAFPDGETAAEAKAAIAAIERAEARRRQEAIDWAKVEKGTDKKDLQRFTLAYPDSAHAGRAREMIGTIEQADARRRQEAIDWAKVEKGTDKKDLQRFVLAYPDSAHVGRARQTIAAIELAEARRRQEAADWAKAEKGGGKSELQRFVATYPDGAYVGRAQERMAAIELADVRRREAVAWAETQKSGEKVDMERFARTRPHSVHAAEARRRVALLEAEERRKDNAAWDKAMRRHSRAAYAGYLTAHPKGHRVADARLRMTELERAEARPVVEPVKTAAGAPAAGPTTGTVAGAPASRPRAPEPSQGWPSADEPFIGADGRIRR